MVADSNDETNFPYKILPPKTGFKCWQDLWE